MLIAPNFGGFLALKATIKIHFVMKPITFVNPDVVIKLTTKQAIDLGIDTTVDAQYAQMNDFGQPYKFVALCLSAKYETEMYTSRVEKTFYGVRSLTNIRQSGYELEGYVSVGGKKYSAFTSSQLFDVDGKLINVQTIHARVKTA